MNGYWFYIVEHGFPSNDEVTEKTIFEAHEISLLTALNCMSDFVKRHPDGHLNTEFDFIEYETEDKKLSAFIEYEED